MRAKNARKGVFSDRRDNPPMLRLCPAYAPPASHPPHAKPPPSRHQAATNAPQATHTRPAGATPQRHPCAAQRLQAAHMRPTGARRTPPLRACGAPRTPRPRGLLARSKPRAASRRKAPKVRPISRQMTPSAAILAAARRAVRGIFVRAATWRGDACRKSRSRGMINRGCRDYPAERMADKSRGRAHISSETLDVRSSNARHPA